MKIRACYKRLVGLAKYENITVELEVEMETEFLTKELLAKATAGLFKELSDVGDSVIDAELDKPALKRR